MKKHFLLIVALICIFFGCQNELTKNINDEIGEVNGIATDALKQKAQEEKVKLPEIKEQVLLQVPFAVQFPTGNMNDPYKRPAKKPQLLLPRLISMAKLKKI